MCACVCIWCMYECMCMYVVVYVHGCIVRVSSYVWLRVTAILYSLVRSKLGNRRFRLVFTVDPIHWQFEDRTTR